MSEQRNLIIAIALSIAIFLVWFVIFPPAHQPATHPSASTAPQQQQQQQQAAAPAPSNLLAPQTAAQPLTVAEALAKSPRVKIDAPRVFGSISLTGARLDDLHLRDYHVTTNKKSPTITLLAPPGTKGAYYVDYGWMAPKGSSVVVPGPNTEWRQVAGNVLAPDRPVTLQWDNGHGLVFQLLFTIDDNYMFHVTQEVRNTTASAVSLQPYSVLRRRQVSKTRSEWFLHQGFVGWLDGSLKDRSWKKMTKNGVWTATSKNGWIGFADKYWLAALAPPQTGPFTVSVGKTGQGAGSQFEAVYQLPTRVIPAGGTTTTKSQTFAGAKEVSVIDHYQHTAGIERFGLAIDWGWFRFLTKPVFMLLDFFKNLTGNFGIAIVLVTIVMRIVFFPLAHRSYESMAKMKKVQPKIKELQERYKDDKQELQKQTMAFYQKEKINPVAGCLPMLLQIPVFYALYIVLFMTIEMRHAHFFGWIHDLSAPDPTSIFNLFGLIPWHVPHALMIGAWPVMYCITMMIQMRINPATSVDPTQKLIMTWMPVVFTFMLASLPVGLLIYWTCSNILMTAQQTIILKRMGTPVEFKRVLGIDTVAKLLSGGKTADKKSGA